MIRPTTASRRLARVTGLGLLPVGLALMLQGAGLIGAPQTAQADGQTVRGQAAAGSDAAVAPADDASAGAAGEGGVRPGQGGGDRAEGGAGRREPLLQAAAPTGITVPALGVKSAVVPVEVTPDGVLDPPSDVSQVGWWERSAPIAASTGQTVLTGHSVHDGGGVFDDLETLSRGDVIKTFHDGALARYRVRSVLVWSQDELAQRAEEVFAQDRERGRLVLVTCEDWNGVEWASNVVVLARRVRA